MPTNTTVRHVSRNHVVISPATGYSVVVFNIAAGADLEAIVISDDGMETIRLLVAGPEAHQTMGIKTNEFGVVDIIYTEKPSAV
jgi:hypothetical protein